MKIKIVNVFQEEFEDTKGAIRNILNFGILTLLAHFINEGSSWSTSSTRRGTSDELAGPSLLVVPVVLLLTSGQFLLH
jgi:hypothetical protein